LGFLSICKILLNKKIREKLQNCGVICPQFGRKNIKAKKEIKKEQEVFLETTYLSDKLRFAELVGDIVFVLRKINSPK